MSEGFFRYDKRALSVLLLLLLVSVYSLTYSGKFITDDEHILSSRSLSLAFDGNLNNDRVYGNSRLYNLSVLPEEYSASAVNVEPAQALLSAFLLQFSAFSGVGHIQALYLLNILVIAFTGVILFRCTLRLGYAKRTAWIVALLFGLCTAAWPYSKTYFRDPLAMMFLALAWASAVALRLQVSRTKKETWLLLAGLILGIAGGVLAKNTAAIALPVLLAYLVFGRGSGISLTEIRNQIADRKWLVPIALLALLLAVALWIRYVPGRGALARFSLDYYFYLIDNFASKSHTGLLQAILGPFFSPGKSQFIYSPVLILALVGLEADRNLAWPAWAYLLLLVIAQGLFYGPNWYGFINWGLRYLLPAIPPLVIAAVPVIDRLLSSRRGTVLLSSLALLSLAIQLLGVLAPVRQYYLELSAVDPARIGSSSLWRFTDSAIPWHFNWLLEGGQLDLAAARIGLPALPISLAWIILIAAISWAALRMSAKWLPPVFLLLVPIMMAGMLFVYREEPGYYRSRADFQAAHDLVASSAYPGDLVIIKAYNTPVWEYWMNWADPELRWISLPLYLPNPALRQEYQATGNPDLLLDDAALDLFMNRIMLVDRAWVVLPGDSPGAPEHDELIWLRENMVEISRWTGANQADNTALYLFEPASGSSPPGGSSR